MDPSSVVGLVVAALRLATDISVMLHNGPYHAYSGASNEVAGLAREVDRLSAALKTLSSTMNEGPGSESIDSSPNKMAETKRVLPEIRSQLESIKILLATYRKHDRPAHTFALGLQDATRRLQACRFVDRLRRLCRSQAPTEENLYGNFQLKTSSRSFFNVGSVFLVLWADPTETAPNVYSPGLARLSNDRTFDKEAGWTSDSSSHARGEVYGKQIYSKVRRFVVVREGEEYCSALPLTTYGGQGVSRTQVVRSHHGIIYTGTTEPPNEVGIPGRQAPRSAISDRSRTHTGLCVNQQGMIKPILTISRPRTAQLELSFNARPDAMVAGPIRVATNGESERLDLLSRLDFGRPYTSDCRIDYDLKKLSGPGAGHSVLAIDLPSCLSKQAMEFEYAPHTKDNHDGEKSLYKRLDISIDGAIDRPPPTIRMDSIPCNSRGFTIRWRPYVRTIVKAAMVLLMPPLLLSVHDYTFRNILDGHSIAVLGDSSSIRGQDDTRHRLVALTSSFVEKAILDPSPLLFFCCAISAAALMRTYGYLNRNDRFQIWFLLTGILCGLVIGLLNGYGLLASALCVMPWSVFFALLVSDILHHGLRAMRPSLKLVEVVCSNGRGCSDDDHILGLHGDSGKTCTGEAEV
ncbi:hypothetical protein LTR78_004084 [Recurvomyces mirabilis]|uniref:DUF6590 domain-containing protein n=1 Tax=Recurvomyces mirabilis TaxID=574656 RepID=A0AAE0WQA9_9PEZI|nr:hypothetical protein LTR78_004084 [Recurvomyces mirabilis]KAK5153743.1 hypothetical protein LTS14_007437 [Recurvomyces mirabilis]